MKKIFILLLFIVSSCGYQPLYKIGSNSEKFKINEIRFKGDTKLSEEIFLELPITIDKNIIKSNILIIDSKKEIQETSKNSKGQVASYRTSIIVKFISLDENENVKNQKRIKKEFSYNSDENKFKFREYQKKVEKNLIDRIVEDIIIHLNS